MTPAASTPDLAVAIPAYNEADGIGGFLAEIDGALSAGRAVALVVADDASTDDTVAVVEASGARLAASVTVVASATNRGHGPTLLDAYRAALATGAPVVVAVDGDGQFTGDDLALVVARLEQGAPAVCGVRRFRVDPWFRMALTRVLRVYVRVWFGVTARDANSPLRGYRADVLDALLDEVPGDAMVPNLHLSVLAATRGPVPVEVDVSHRERRGAESTGTMFDRGSTRRTILRLARFSAGALVESLRLRARLDRGAPVRQQV